MGVVASEEKNTVRIPSNNQIGYYRNSVDPHPEAKYGKDQSILQLNSNIANIFS